MSGSIEKTPQRKRKASKRQRGDDGDDEEPGGHQIFMYVLYPSDVQHVLLPLKQKAQVSRWHQHRIQQLPPQRAHRLAERNVRSRRRYITSYVYFISEWCCPKIHLPPGESCVFIIVYIFKLFGKRRYFLNMIFNMRCCYIYR